jgi:hypothetical protein
VSPVLDLFVCTLAAGPKAVIVALWVYEFLLVSRSSQEVVKCFNGYRVMILPDNGNNRFVNR